MWYYRSLHQVPTDNSLSSPHGTLDHTKPAQCTSMQFRWMRVSQCFTNLVVLTWNNLRKSIKRGIISNKTGGEQQCRLFLV